MASGILLRFRRAPLHMLRNLLYSAFFVVWLVYRVLLGFLSLPSLPVVLGCYCLGLVLVLGVG